MSTSVIAKPGEGFASHAPRRGRQNCDMLDDLFSWAGNFPPLPREKEYQLGKRAMQGDLEAQEMLVRHNVRFAISRAKMFRNNSEGVPFPDLIHAAVVGLCIAATRYDPAHGTKFFSYARFWIRKELLRVLSAHSVSCTSIPQQLCHEMNFISRIENSLKQQGILRPTTEQIADLSQLPVRTVRRVRMARKQRAVPLHADPRFPEREGAEAVAVEAYEDAEHSKQVTARREEMLKELRAELGRFLAHSTQACSRYPDQIARFRLHYGLDNGLQGKTLREIGAMYNNVTRQAIKLSLDSFWKRCGPNYSQEWFETRLKCAVYLMRWLGRDPATLFK